MAKGKKISTKKKPVSHGAEVIDFAEARRAFEARALEELTSAVDAVFDECPDVRRDVLERAVQAAKTFLVESPPFPRPKLNRTKKRISDSWERGREILRDERTNAVRRRFSLVHRLRDDSRDKIVEALMRWHIGRS